MKLSAYLANVIEVLREDTSTAFSLMAADIEDLHRELSEGMSKEYNKDLRKRAQQDQALAPHYRGVSPKLAAWGKEAHAYGMHAHGMETAGKAPKAKILAAHVEAGKAHQFASAKLSGAGHSEPAQMHKQAAQYHRRRVDALGGMDEGIADDLKTANIHAHMAQWRAGQLKKKLANKAASTKPRLTYSAVVPKAKLGESIEDYILESYPEAVKQASMLAGKATKTAQADNASPDQHDTASRLHLIAHGVAKAHGHEDLAKKHMDFHVRHKASAKAVKTA